MIGQTLGHYHIVGKLGEGGMGKVYRARDTKLGRDVALKVLPDTFARDSEGMARFEREARVLASLNHPNIAAIYGLEEDALVMELVEGEMLRGPLVLEKAIGYARQMAEALEYAHEKGIVHRDLKPANVKVTPDGVVKILDFGVAKIVTEAAVSEPASALTVAETSPGVIIGTVAYMAPEQARGEAVDKRADIWAYGVVLYEMLTGRRPFAGKTTQDILSAVLSLEPDLDEIPPELRRLVRRCMEKDPKRRWRDIGDVRLALEERPEPAPVPKRKAILPWIVAGVLATALAAALLLFWRMTRPVSRPLVRLNVELGPEAELNLEYGASAILSPDGTRLVYTGRGADSVLRLYTRTLDQEQATALAGTEGAESPFFSPDGSSVGFFAGGKLKKVSVREGGGSVVLCEVGGDARGASWGDDGDIIAALSSSQGLSRVSAGTGAVRPLTERNREFSHRWPDVLPGSRAVLFTAATIAGDMSVATIEVQSLRTGERKTLMRRGYYGRYVRSGHLIFVRDGALFAAPMDISRLEMTGPAVSIVEQVTSSVNFGGAQLDPSASGTLVYSNVQLLARLVWLDESNSQKPLLDVKANYHHNPALSPDGKRVAIGVREGGNTELWVYESERDQSTRLTFAPGVDSAPVWTPDGKYVVFSSTRHGGVENLYAVPSDGAGETIRLTEKDNPQYAQSFSPDGKYLVFFEVNRVSKRDFWILPMDLADGDPPKPGQPRLLLGTSANEWYGRISPDGQWLAYSSDESGTYEVYVRRFSGTASPTEVKWQISNGGGNHPEWSSKGRELFYGSDRGMMVSAYSTNGEVFVPGKPRVWVENKGLSPHSYDLAPDGKRFALIAGERPEKSRPARVVFLQNFFDELRRRAP